MSMLIHVMLRLIDIKTPFFNTNEIQYVTVLPVHNQVLNDLVPGNLEEMSLVVFFFCF